mgnify:FL=1
MNIMIKKLNFVIENVLDQLTGAERPKLYFKPQSSSAKIIEELDQLQNKYRPTPWLANTHIHLLYFDLIRKRTIQLEYDKVDQLTMQDGGVTAVVWFGYDLPKDTPTIVLMHTITGSPESMRELVKDLNKYTGWRIALCIRRGHAKLPMPVPKINLFGSTADLKEQIEFIQTTFPKSDLYGVGSSAGTGLLVRYLGEEGEQTPLKAAFALCPGYNTETGFNLVHPFYSKVMTKKLFKAFIHPYKTTWASLSDVAHVLHTTNLQDFQSRYYHLAGYESLESYHKAVNPVYVFENVKIPLMILNAEDDPVCHIQNLEPYKDMIQNMDNIVVVTTKKGSHCGFYEGTRSTHSWANKLMAEFLLTQTKTR